MPYRPDLYDYSEYSKRYYAKKKGLINAKRKTKRDQFKERMKHLEERVARCIVEMEEDDSPQPEYERRNGKPFLPASRSPGTLPRRATANPLFQGTVIFFFFHRDLII
jgi:hypothetical protein